MDKSFTRRFLSPDFCLATWGIGVFNLSTGLIQDSEIMLSNGISLVFLGLLVFPAIRFFVKKWKEKSNESGEND